MNNYATDPTNTMSRKEFIVLNIVAVLTLATIFITLVLTWYSTNKIEDTSYNTIAEVYLINNEEMLMVDGAGDVWAVDKRADLTEGDFVRLYLNDNNTDYTKRDDIIVKVEKLDN